MDIQSSFRCTSTSCLASSCCRCVTYAILRYPRVSQIALGASVQTPDLSSLFPLEASESWWLIWPLVLSWPCTLDDCAWTPTSISCLSSHVCHFPASTGEYIYVSIYIHICLYTYICVWDIYREKRQNFIGGCLHIFKHGLSTTYIFTW